MNAERAFALLRLSGDRLSQLDKPSTFGVSTSADFHSLSTTLDTGEQRQTAHDLTSQEGQVKDRVSNTNRPR